MAKVSRSAEGCIGRDPARVMPTGHAALAAPFVFSLGLRPLALVHVVVLAIGQFPVVHVLPAPEAYDDRFHNIPTSMVRTDHRSESRAGQVTRVMPGVTVGHRRR